MSFSPFLSVLPTMLLFYVRGVSAERRTLQTCRLDLTAPTSGSAAADATVETVRRAVTSAAVSSLFRSPRGDNEIAFREHKCANIELRGSVRSCNKNNEMDPPCLPPRKRLYESASRLVSLGSRRLARQWRGLLNGRVPDWRISRPTRAGRRHHCKSSGTALCCNSRRNAKRERKTVPGTAIWSLWFCSIMCVTTQRRRQRTLQDSEAVRRGTGRPTPAVHTRARQAAKRLLSGG